MADDLSQYEVGDDLSKYEVKPSGIPISSSSTIQAQPSSGSKAIGAAEDVGHSFVNSNFPFVHPFDAMNTAANRIGDISAPIENYTQEGRAEHPVLSKLGDVTRNAKDLGNIVGPEISTLSAAADLPEKIPAIGEGLNTARNALATTFRKPYSGTLKPWVPRIPFASWATDAIVPRGEEGTITNPMVVTRGTQVPEGKFYKTTSIQKAGPDLPSKIVSPAADRGPVRVGSEGRPATWTNEDVVRLAKEGNRDAIAQLGERGKNLPPNVRYVMGDLDYPRVIYNPRDVTRFTPEGTPIRTGGKKVIAAPE